MRYMALALALMPGAAFAGPGAGPPADHLVGLFSNEEQVYFDKEAKRNPPPPLILRISKTDGGYHVEALDAFGASAGPSKTLMYGTNGKYVGLNNGRCIRIFKPVKGALEPASVIDECEDELNISRADFTGITLVLPGGATTSLRRARHATCWGSTLREAKKPDGSPDWFFAAGLKLHDQGGRVAFGGGDTGAQPVTLRMRNVVWPTGNNSRPSLVLYIHKPEKPDSAESYVWGDPGAARLGINLRWVQASCSIDGLDTPVTIKTEPQKR